MERDRSEPSDEDRVDIPTPVAFFDAVEAQHQAKHFDPNPENDSLYDYEPSEAGTEDIEAAVREGTGRSLGLDLGQLRIANEQLNTSGSESQKPEADIDAPTLAETVHDSPVSLQPVELEEFIDVPHRGATAAHDDITPTMPYLSLDRTKPITNVGVPRRTFFKDDKSRRDLSLVPGTKDNIKIKGEVIPQETFERLKYASTSRLSNYAQSIASTSTITKPKSKASTTPSIYSRESASRSTPKLIGEDDDLPHRPSPTDMKALDGMVAMHLEAEKERIKKIAKGVRQNTS
jgi:hypothetical protein